MRGSKSLVTFSSLTKLNSLFWADATRSNEYQVFSCWGFYFYQLAAIPVTVSALPNNTTLWICFTRSQSPDSGIMRFLAELQGLGLFNLTQGQRPTRRRGFPAEWLLRKQGVDKHRAPAVFVLTAATGESQLATTVTVYIFMLIIAIILYISFGYN